MNTNRWVTIERRIERIKAELAAIGDMRPGSLTKQYKDPESQSGPYYQLSYTLDRQSRTEYIRRESVADIRRRVSNYKRFKKLCAEWIALGIEHSRLAIKLTTRQ
ncbi:MAG: DUF6788 family protein [Candidatus Binatia bacterium]|jgi:hypothetical protein|nr:DUF6788 family protein [Candidatus Binatia bacterium]